MALQKVNVGTNEDGSVRWLFVNDDPNAHLVVTGPITGTVVLPDGSKVDVTEPVIEVSSPEQAVAVSDAIGQRYVDEGHPNHDGEVPFEFAPAELPTADTSSSSSKKG